MFVARRERERHLARRLHFHLKGYGKVKDSGPVGHASARCGAAGRSIRKYTYLVPRRRVRLLCDWRCDELMNVAEIIDPASNRGVTNRFRGTIIGFKFSTRRRGPFNTARQQELSKNLLVRSRIRALEIFHYGVALKFFSKALVTKASKASKVSKVLGDGFSAKICGHATGKYYLCH